MDQNMHGYLNDKGKFVRVRPPLDKYGQQVDIGSRVVFVEPTYPVMYGHVGTVIEPDNPHDRLLMSAVFVHFDGDDVAAQAGLRGCWCAFELIAVAVDTSTPASIESYLNTDGR